MLEFLPFWVAQKEWPLDQGGKVFLGRALLRLGAELLGQRWAGFEFAIIEDRPLAGPKPGSRFTVNTNAQAAAVHRTLTKAGHELLPAWPFPMNGNSQFVQSRGYFWPDAKQIFEADRLEAERIKAARLLVAENLTRRDAVAELLTTAILAGLPTYWQNPKDGSLDNSIPLGWWNLPSRKAYFATCRINPAEPATGAAPSPWQSYIFVNGESLYQLIATYRAELAKRLAAAQPEAVAWWPGQPRGAAKAWIFRPAVQAEALARLGDTRTKDAYVRALDAMQNEAPSDPWKPGTIGRTLRKYPEAWPADLT